MTKVPAFITSAPRQRRQSSRKNRSSDGGQEIGNLLDKDMIVSFPVTINDAYLYYLDYYISILLK